MLTKTLLGSGLFVLTLGAVAVASPSKPTSQAQLLTGHTKDVRKLLSETRAARDAIERNEPKAARDIVDDAIMLESTFAGNHRFAVVGSSTGTVEEISNVKGVPIVKAFDRYAEKELLDLNATRRDLAAAKRFLQKGEMQAAAGSLMKIGSGIEYEANIHADHKAQAEENLSLSKRELAAGNVKAAEAEAAAAQKEMAPAPKSPSKTK